MHQLYQLNLFELMLTDHAARVPTVCTSFTAETRGMADMFDGQLFRGNNFIPVDVGDWHLSCWDEIGFGVLGQAKLVFSKLRQLTGAI